jgi:hypothetical protein
MIKAGFVYFIYLVTYGITFMKIHGKSSNRRLELIMEHADLARKIMNTLRFMEIHWVGEENSD